MARRRSRSESWSTASQDPGKDLFAFLFIMVTIFTVMMLKSAEQRADLAGQNSPDRVAQGRASLSTVATDHIGHLERRDGKLVLIFDNKAYSPKQDLMRMEQDGWITSVPGNDGQEKKLLYLEDDRNGRVLLGEYLEAFQQLSRSGISVAFVERML